MAEPIQHRPASGPADGAAAADMAAAQAGGTPPERVEATGIAAAEVPAVEAVTPVTGGEAPTEAGETEYAGSQATQTGQRRRQTRKAAAPASAAPKATGLKAMAHGTETRREATRKRILKAAGQLFREHGIDGTGVDAVMRQAGLTHGGFYLHFPSKEALAAEVARSLLQRAAGRWDAISRGPDCDAALERIVRDYLDPHRVASAHCCPLTTLGPDVARRSASREAVGDALRGMLEALGRALPASDCRRQDALASLSTMVGAVVLARLADDPVLAEAFLEAAADRILPGRPEVGRRELLAGAAPRD